MQCPLLAHTIALPTVSRYSANASWSVRQRTLRSAAYADHAHQEFVRNNLAEPCGQMPIGSDGKDDRSVGTTHLRTSVVSTKHALASAEASVRHAHIT
jgi:hypothetical protein